MARYEEGDRSKVEFQTIKAEEIKFGRNNFLEVARKVAKTPEGDNEFVSISKGFYQPDGSKRFKTSFTLPKEAEVLAEVSRALKEV